MKKNKTKGQITIVLLMVMILIIIFSVLYYVQRSSDEAKSEDKRQAIELSQQKLEPLKEYVTSCLDISAKAGLAMVGEQGGYLYVSQGGKVPDFRETEFGSKYIEFNNKKVAYAILPPVGNIGPMRSDPPEYPWKTFPEVYNSSGGLVNASSLKGYFGRNVLPNLEKPFKNSLQEQLEFFVSKNSADCLDLDNFQTQQLNIIRGEPVVNVTLTEKNVAFELDYPLKIVENITGAEAQLRKFAVQYDVRLKKIIQLMEQSTSRDIAEADYNITNNDSFVMRTWVENDIEKDDDIVFIRDPESTILGQPYTFLYARKNRAPALVHINSTENNKKYSIGNFTLCSVRLGDAYIGAKIKIENETLVLENQHADCRNPTTRIPLYTFDPDEDAPEYLIEVDGNEYKEYEIPKQFVGVVFSFRVVAQDKSLQDSEELTMKTEVVTPL